MTQSSQRLRQLAKAISWGTVALLVAFHAGLLAVRVGDGSLAHPAVAAKWLATLAIGWGLYRLRAQGVSLLRGRAAIALWVLGLMLHALAAPVAAPVSFAETWWIPVGSLLASSLLRGAARTVRGGSSPLLGQLSRPLQGVALLSRRTGSPADPRGPPATLFT